MSIKWVTAFLDFPDATFAEGTVFWQHVVGSSLSPPRGQFGEFATLLPSSGDAYLRVQRLEEGAASCHVDLHVDDIVGVTNFAIELGATQISQGPAIRTLRSPGGLKFCVVQHHDEHQRPRPTRWDEGQRSLVDQISIDVSSLDFETECNFWSAFTSWTRHQGARSEFVYLERPENIPLRFLFQRLEEPRGVASAHLDIACDDREREITRHVVLGARRVRDMDYWTTLSDPTGFEYCITIRNPDSGQL